MMESHNLVSIVVLLAIAVYFWTSLRVGLARQKYGVPAPAMTGHPDFERLARVQANTLESLPLFLPALWLFAAYWNDHAAAAIGGVWILGRILYALGYSKAADKRGRGFMIQMLASFVLWVGALAGALMAFSQGFQ